MVKEKDFRSSNAIHLESDGGSGGIFTENQMQFSR